MKITKVFGVFDDSYPNFDGIFFNESDRNEMALALYEEFVYEVWARFVNWYGEDDIKEVKALGHDHVFIYDSVLVEG